MTIKADMIKYLLISLLCSAFFLWPAVPPIYASDTKGSPVLGCEINHGSCSKNIGEVSVTLDITPKPVKAMKELIFTVTVKGTKEYESLRLKLQMPGMFMGNNEVKLVKSGNGKYTGKGVVPKCHSGKRLWSAILELPGLNPSEVSFLFNVLY